MPIPWRGWAFFCWGWEIVPVTVREPTPIQLMPCDLDVLGASDGHRYLHNFQRSVACFRGGLRADHVVGFDRVHIRCCGNGHLGFRSYSGSLLEERQK